MSIWGKTSCRGRGWILGNDESIHEWRSKYGRGTSSIRAGCHDTDVDEAASVHLSSDSSGPWRVAHIFCSINRGCWNSSEFQSFRTPPLAVRAHSTMSAVPSKALARGASLQDACTAAGWSSPHTFIRFYSLEFRECSHSRDSQPCWTGTLPGHGMGHSHSINATTQHRNSYSKGNVSGYVWFPETMRRF